jgi:hypothetical protein
LEFLFLSKLIQIIATRRQELAVNESLDRLARDLELNSSANEHLRLQFGYACTRRVEHLLEEPGVVDCLRGLGRYLQGAIGPHEFAACQSTAARLATQHQGSKSIDGCGHAAVSATYAVANALAGKALQAAEYAAYALVYGQGGYGAVADRDSFQAEFSWQLNCLASLAGHGQCFEIELPSTAS